MPKGNVTPNDLVARNLQRARELRDWRQPQARSELRRHGIDWSPTTYSNAERGARKFTADDLVGICAAFGLPVAWFLLGDDETVRLSKRSATLTRQDLVRTLFVINEDMKQRLAEADIPEDLERLLQDTVLNIMSSQIKRAAGGELDRLGQLVNLANEFTGLMYAIYEGAIDDANVLLIGKPDPATDEETP